jgi:uncharacterized protein
LFILTEFGQLAAHLLHFVRLANGIKGNPMNLRRFKDILAVRSGDEIFGFHARNLQVAKLDEAAWEALTSREPSNEATHEIQSWNGETDLTVTNDELTQSTRSLVINITQYCNLRCTYCAAGGDGTYGTNQGAGGKVDLQILETQLKKFIGETPNGETFHVQFFGGEPLLHPEAIRSLANYSKLLVAGRDVAIKFSITTNGTMITPAVAELLADLKCNVTVSIDGPPEINDRVRPSAGGKGSTEKVLKGIATLFTVRDRLGGIGVNCVLGEHNMELVKAYEFFQPYQFDFINFIYAAGEHDRTLNQKYISEMDTVMEMADRFGGEHELRKFPYVDHYFSALDRQSRTINHCGAGKSLLYSDTKGSLYTCNWFMDDPKEIVGKGTTLFPQALKEYEDPLVEKHGCNSCFARFLCGGGCMFINKVKMGDKHVSDPHYCVRTRSLVATTLKYYARHRLQNEVA